MVMTVEMMMKTMTLHGYNYDEGFRCYIMKKKKSLKLKCVFFLGNSSVEKLKRAVERTCFLSAVLLDASE